MRRAAKRQVSDYDMFRCVQFKEVSAPDSCPQPLSRFASGETVTVEIVFFSVVKICSPEPFHVIRSRRRHHVPLVCQIGNAVCIFCPGGTVNKRFSGNRLPCDRVQRFPCGDKSVFSVFALNDNRGFLCPPATDCNGSLAIDPGKQGQSVSRAQCLNRFLKRVRRCNGIFCPVQEKRNGRHPYHDQFFIHFCSFLNIAVTIGFHRRGSSVRCPPEARMRWLASLHRNCQRRSGEAFRICGVPRVRQGTPRCSRCYASTRTGKSRIADN